MEEILSAFLFKKLKHEIYLTLDVMMHVERTQILEFMFRRDPEIGDLKYLFKIFFILIILAIINPEIWVVLVGGLLYFTYHFVRSHISS